MDQEAKDRYKLLQSYIGERGLKDEYVQQLLMKVEKNRWGGREATAVFPFTQFFNHACNPNVFSVSSTHLTCIYIIYTAYVFIVCPIWQRNGRDITICREIDQGG